MGDKKEMPVPVLPARGAVAGVRADVNRAKGGGPVDPRDPRGFGAAFSHNFLHPMNFRNQVRKFDAEMRYIQEAKDKERAEGEWKAEQEAMLTQSYMSAEDQQRYRDRAAVSFMYTKPPGLDAALARDKEREAAEAKKAKEEEDAEAAGAAALQGQASTSGALVAAQAAAGRGAAGGLPPLPPHLGQLDRLREDPLASMLAARRALEVSERFELVRGMGSTAGGRSPPRGGISSSAANQQLLGDEEEWGPAAQERSAAAAGPSGAGGDEAEALLASLSESERRAVLKALDKKRKREAEAARLAEAQAVLRAAGYSGALTAEEGAHGSGKTKKHKKEKHKAPKKKHKKERGRRDERSHHSGSQSDSGSALSEDDRRQRQRRRQRSQSYSPRARQR